MKKAYIIISAVLSVLTVSAQNDTINTAKADTAAVKGSAWENANAAYAEGRFQIAEMLYTGMIESGCRDAAVFYNLGNACFQQNQIGKAILNYKRANLADPSDGDIEYNLQIAQSKTKDKIDSVPVFFLAEWLTSVRDMMSPNGWAKTSIICLVLCLAAVLMWLLAGPLGLRKTGFYIAAITAVFFIASIINGLSAASNMYSNDEAIVTVSAALIKSSPSESGKDLCIVHEGTSVEETQELDGWSEVQLADGTKGWIVSSSIEKVNLE